MIGSPPNMFINHNMLGVWPKQCPFALSRCPKVLAEEPFDTHGRYRQLAYEHGTFFDVNEHVHHIFRDKSPASRMSQYLVARIESSSHITLYPNSEIEKLEGESSLESAWANRVTGERTVKPIGSVFVMIGAEPNSGRLFGTVRLDKKGFILTGGADGFESAPYATSVPGSLPSGTCGPSP